MPARILIAGGGFGGLYAARMLERKLGSDAQITMVNEDNFLLYQPLIPGVGAGELEPRHVVVPLRQMLKRTDLRVGTVMGADPERRVITATGPDGVLEHSYDHLLVALGAVSRQPNIPGLAGHALPFKTVFDALVMRDSVISSFETAEQILDPDERASWLTYVFCGGGYTGVEGLAELQDFAADVVKLYPRCAEQGMRWVLVEGEQRIMKALPESLAEFTTKELEKRGIEVKTGIRLDKVTDDTVHLENGEAIPARMLVWTAGITPSKAVGDLNLPLDGHGRIVTDSNMQVEGHDNVWAVGDAAAVPDPAVPGEACPQTAQHALRQGRAVGKNIAAAVKGGEPKPFTYKTKGLVVGLGHGRGVASLMGVKLRGWPAFFFARTYHWLAMPGAYRRLRLAGDWAFSAWFPRDSSAVGGLRAPTSSESE